MVKLMDIRANTNFTHFLFLLLEEQEQEADPDVRDVQEEGEIIDIQEDMETPPGDWWQRV